MTKTLDDQIQELTPQPERREHYLDRLNQTIKLYGEEITQGIRDNQWQSVYRSGLHAGHLYCLLGRTQQGLEMLQKSFALHDSMADYNRDEFLAESLVFILQTMDKFGLTEGRNNYQERLDAIQQKKKQSESDQSLRKKVVHLESDLECETGDLDASYAHGRREQGLLYQKLGEYDKAIEHFQRAIQEDRRDWRSETSIKNRLSIVDSYLAMDKREEALKEFLTLMGHWVQSDINMGDEISDEFTSNFSQFKPYFKRLGIDDKSHEYARARLDKIKPDLKSVKRASGEVRQLTEILLHHYDITQQWNNALLLMSEVEEATKVLDYPEKFSNQRKSQYHINTERVDEARELLDSQSRADLFSFARNGEHSVMEMTRQYFQIGEPDKALDLLDVYAKNDRRSSLWMNAIETRVMQIDILGRLIGTDYIQRLREGTSGNSDLFQNNPVKYLTSDKMKKEKKAKPAKADDEEDL